MYPTQCNVINSFYFLQNFRSPSASSFHLLVHLRRYIWIPFTFFPLALCLVIIYSINCSSFIHLSHRIRQQITWKLRTSCQMREANFDIPHSKSYLSRILNVRNLLRFSQRCRSPTLSLHRSMIHTLIAHYPNRLSFPGHLTSCASPLWHASRWTCPLSRRCVPILVAACHELPPSLPDEQLPSTAWWWMQLALPNPRFSVRITSMDTLTASSVANSNV